METENDLFFPSLNSTETNTGLLTRGRRKIVTQAKCHRNLVAKESAGYVFKSPPAQGSPDTFNILQNITQH